MKCGERTRSEVRGWGKSKVRQERNMRLRSKDEVCERNGGAGKEGEKQ